MMRVGYEGLARLLDQTDGQPILVVGDLVLDRYVEGAIERVNREAPVGLVEVRREYILPGGAANAAAKLAQLGAQPRLVGAVGEDAGGQALRELLEARRVDPAGLLAVPARPTPAKTRILARGQQLLRLDREERGPYAHELAAEIERRAIAALDGVAAALVSDYGKGLVSCALLDRLIGAAAERRIPLVIDPAIGRCGEYRGAFLVVPNRYEAATGLGLPETTAPLELAAGWQARTGAHVAVGLGADGLVLLERGGAAVEVPAVQRREVFDPTGAGDALAAGAAVGLAANWSLVDGLRLGSLAAGVVIQQVGVGEVSSARMRALLGEAIGRSAVKHMDRQQAVRWRESLRGAGERLVFTNGCFDLLHAGHVKLLEAAARMGDRLLVGVNSDRSVRALKGPNRPILSEPERVQMLAALDFVDGIVIFDEESVLGLVEAIRPDVLVKGGDYRRDQVVGWEVVESYGGEVRLVSLADGISTSSIVERVLRGGAPSGGQDDTTR